MRTFLFVVSLALANAAVLNTKCYSDWNCKCVNRFTTYEPDAESRCVNDQCVCSGGNVNINGRCVKNDTETVTSRVSLYLKNLDHQKDTLYIGSRLKSLVQSSIESSTTLTSGQYQVSDPIITHADDYAIVDIAAPIKNQDEIIADLDGYLNSVFNNTRDIQLTDNFLGCGQSCEVLSATESVQKNGTCYPTQCQTKNHLIEMHDGKYECHLPDDDEGLQGEEIAGIVIASLLCCCLLVLLLLCLLCKKGDASNAKNAPDGVVEISPEPENFTHIVNVPPPAPQASTRAINVDPKEQKAARILQNAFRRNMNVKQYRRSLDSWKVQEAKRKQLLTTGKSGAIGMSLSPSLEVTRVKPGGAADLGGIKVGDKVVAAQTMQRGYLKTDAVDDSTSLLNALGPQNEVYAGSSVLLFTLRGTDKKAAFSMSALADPQTSKAAHDKYISTALQVGVEKREIKLQEETEGVVSTRLRKMNEIKAKKNLTKMNTQLCNDFISDPDSCRAFTKSVFDKADADKSGELSLKELDSVFIQMANHTGVSPPTAEEKKKLFYQMDKSYNGQVDFDEFFPHFRIHQVRAITRELYNEQTEE